MALKSRGTVLAGVYLKVIDGGVKLACTEVINQSGSNILVYYGETSPVDDSNSFNLAPNQSHHTLHPAAHVWVKGTGKVVTIYNEE